MNNRTTPLLDTVKENIKKYFHNSYYMDSIKNVISSIYMKEEMDKMVSRFITEYRSPQPIKVDMLIEGIVFVARAGTLSLSLHPEVLRDKGRHNFNINNESLYYDNDMDAIIYAIDTYFANDTTDWKNMTLNDIDIMLCKASREYNRTYINNRLDLYTVGQICVVMMYGLDKKFITGE